MFPPSWHPDGERVTWERDGGPAQIAAQELQRASGILAAAALLMRYWPPLGSRYLAYGALIGTMLRCGVEAGVVEAIVRIIADRYPPGRSRERRIATVAAMRRRLDEEKGERVPGFPRLKEIFGDDVAKKVREWLPRPAEASGGPYDVVDGCLTYWKQAPGGVVPVQLANFQAHIVEDQIIDDGATEDRRYRIAGALANGTILPEIALPVKDFSGVSWVDRYWGARAIVTVGSGWSMLNTAIKSVSGELPEHRVFGHLGWRRIGERWLYLHAGGAIGAEGPVSYVSVEVDRDLAGFVLPRVLDLPRAVRAALRFFELNIVLASTVWRAPLCEFKAAPFSPFLAGRTGVLKSAVLGVAQAHWGTRWDGVRFAASWRDTANTLEKKAFLLKDMLLGIDDFAVGTSRKMAAELQEKGEAVLRGQGNLAGRGRMHADTSLRPTYFPRGIVGATGEVEPAGHSLRARMVIDQITAGSVDVALLTELQKAGKEGLLAEAMAGFVAWLAAFAEEGGLPLRLEQRQQKHCDKIPAAPAAHMRTADAAASMMLGAEAFLEFAKTVGVPVDDMQKETVWQALNASAVEQAVEQDTDDPVRLFTEAIPSVLSAGRAHIDDRSEQKPPPGDPAMLGWRKPTSIFITSSVHGTPTTEFEIASDPGEPTERRAQGDCIGWADKEGLWLLPEPAIKAVNDMLRAQGREVTLNHIALGRRLREAGWLTAWDKNTFTKLTKIKGAPLRVFAMNRVKVLGEVTEGF
jgi:hypothetical protein